MLLSDIVAFFLGLRTVFKQSGGDGIGTFLFRIFMSKTYVPETSLDVDVSVQ